MERKKEERKQGLGPFLLSFAKAGLKKSGICETSSLLRRDLTVNAILSVNHGPPEIDKRVILRSKNIQRLPAEGMIHRREKASKASSVNNDDICDTARHDG